MPFTLDTFTHLFDWEKDPQRQEKIVNARLEAEFDGVDTGLSASAARITTVEAAVAAGVADGSITTAKLADDAVTYAKMQNISATARILGRKTAGAGDTEECTLSEVLDFIASATQGDILYRGASAWARLPAGTSGNFLKTNGAGADPAWAAAAGTTLVGTQTGSGTTPITFTGIPTCKLLLAAVDRASHNNGANQTLRVELSNNNGSSWAAAVAITSAVSAAVIVSGEVSIARIDQSSRFPITGVPPASGFIATVDAAATGPINAVRFSWSAGSWDGASNTIDLYAIA